MFKKPFADLKTSAPLRSSDRKKLKQRLLQSFPNLQPEEGDILVPDGLQLQKFSSHIEEPGVAYLSPEGDPLWFSIGKGSEDLIPTVYTLWKRPDLLPSLSTPAPVVPKLIGGADLMIPGVVQHPPSLVRDQLVSVTQHHRHARGPPVAVGRMAVPSDTLFSAERADVKGKAVFVLHTWKDALWDMGPNKQTNPPVPTENQPPGADASTNEAQQNDSEEGPAEPDAAAGTDAEDTVPQPLTAQDVSDCLRASLLQAIGTTLSSVPPSTFPIIASIFWSAYVLPARPGQTMGTNDASSIDVKLSTYKNVKTFLKASAKEGLLKLKEIKGDVVVTAVYPEHPAVTSRRPHRTIGDMEARMKKAEDREQKEREAEERRKGEIRVSELWQPFANAIPLFVSAKKDTSDLYTMEDIKNIVNEYITSRRLVNANDQQYINVRVEPALYDAVSVKGQDTPDFMKRDDVLKRVRRHMQGWYEVAIEGQDPIRKKGELKPISVVVSIRQGKKACTLVTGYEPFGLQGDDLAEELRKRCASSTSVSPIPGKPNMLEIMVQGKQIKGVTDMLIARGVTKEWIVSQGPKKK